MSAVTIVNLYCLQRFQNSKNATVVNVQSCYQQTIMDFIRSVMHSEQGEREIKKDYDSKGVYLSSQVWARCLLCCCAGKHPLQ